MSNGRDRTQIPQCRLECERGRQAIQRVVALKKDVAHAMHREELGDIDFRYGNANEGVAHILKRTAQRQERFLDDVWPEQVLEMMPEVIAFGRVAKNGRVAHLEYNGWRAVLAGDYHGKPSRRWLLSGFDLDPRKK